MLLSYCTNVHPAEDLAGVLDQLDAYAGPARRAAGLDRLGVGLWLTADLARVLAPGPGFSAGEPPTPGVAFEGSSVLRGARA